MYDERGHVNCLTGLCRPRHVWCWRCANSRVASSRIGDFRAGGRRTCLSVRAEMISCCHVGLGAAVRVRGQMDDMSIFNLI